MWNVLIADDEPKIRQGLRKTLETFDLDLNIAAEARNGLDALEKAKEFRPDLMLVDICMPKMSGIEFLQEIRKLGLESQVVVISGFDEFSYAQQAIELGVCSFMLKPIEEEKLYQVLARAVETISQKQRQQKIQDLLRQQLKQNREHLQNVFFNDWVEAKLTEEEWQLQAELLELELAENLLMIFVSLDMETMVLPEGTGAPERLYELAIANAVDSCVSENGLRYIFVNRYQDVVVLLKDAGGEPKDLRNNLAKEIAALGAEKQNIQISSCRREDVPEIHEQLCAQARKIMECRPIVMEARKYLYANYSRRDLDLPQVAEAIGCNPSYLSRIMKQELGMSFKDFLTNLRINQAILLMRKGSVPLNVIAEQVGYNNQHYFSAAFKNSQGVSPSEYRKAML